jgi:hypothetical protein
MTNWKYMESAIGNHEHNWLTSHINFRFIIPSLYRRSNLARRRSVPVFLKRRKCFFYFYCAFRFYIYCFDCDMSVKYIILTVNFGMPESRRGSPWCVGPGPALLPSSCASQYLLPAVKLEHARCLRKFHASYTPILHETDWETCKGNRWKGEGEWWCDCTHCWLLYSALFEVLYGAQLPPPCIHRTAIGS